VEHRLVVANVGVIQRFKRATTDVGLAHADHQADYQRSFHQPAAMLRTSGEMLVDVQRMLIHAHQAEERVVKLSDGAAGPVAKMLPCFEFVEIAAVRHGKSYAAGGPPQAPL
jgi:hypothetical protein